MLFTLTELCDKPGNGRVWSHRRKIRW